VLDDQRVEECWQLLDRLRGLLSQGWYYAGSEPGRSQSECRKTECADILALTAELCADSKRMADALGNILIEAVRLKIGTETIRNLVGVDIVTLTMMYEQLADDLAAAGNRALDTIGKNNGDTQRFPRTTAPDSQRLPSSRDPGSG
jgi:hypothetical protein